MCFSLNTDSLYLLASTLLSNSQQFLPSPNFSAFSPKDDFYKVNNNAFLKLLFSPTSLITEQHSYLLVLLDGLPRFFTSQQQRTCPPTQETKETWVWSLDEEDALREGMGTHSSILAWRIPWTEEPGGLQTTESQRTGQAEVTYHVLTACFLRF